MKRINKSLLALILSIVMCISYSGNAFAATLISGTELDEEEIEQISPQGLITEDEIDLDEPEADPEEDVSIFIEFDNECVLDRFDASEIDSVGAKYLNNAIKNSQEIMINRISWEALGGRKLEIDNSFSIVTNCICTTVKQKEIEAIKNVPGVKSISKNEEVELMEDEGLGEVREKMDTANQMTGNVYTWDNGYTGAGIKVAVIDSSFQVNHELFSEEGFEYGLSEGAEATGKTVDDYDLFGEEDIENVLSNLNSYSYDTTVTAGDLYKNKKVAYAYNYGDKTVNVLPNNEAHGTHVAGIAAGNKYIPNGDGTYSLQENGVSGAAYNAQLLLFAVFDSEGHAYSATIASAMEDAVVLGVDVINLSMGGSAPGNERQMYNPIQQAMDRIENAGIIFNAAASNSSYWSKYSTYGANLAEDVSLHTVSNMASVKNVTAVANITNIGHWTPTIRVADELVEYSDSEGVDALETLDTSAGNLGTDYDYEFLSGYGTEDDYTSVNVSGKFVFVARGGGLSFFEKHEIAASKGAVALVVYNYNDDPVTMNMKGVATPMPAAFISKTNADRIKELSQLDGATLAYTGTLTVKKGIIKRDSGDYGMKMDGSSSLGVPGGLTLKPEIAAPGGSIFSSVPNSKYESMSGTSMASPHATGVSALALQYIKENNLSEKTGLRERELVTSLIMSTAIPITDKEDRTYSPRQQGAGLINSNSIVTTPSYILVGEKTGNDGKVKVELGDDPDRTGQYSVSFTVYNFAGETQYYDLDSTVLTEQYTVGSDMEELIKGIPKHLAAKATFSSSDMSLLFDLNQDGQVDEADAACLLSHINESETLTIISQREEEFDFNNNGYLDTNDVSLFLEDIESDTPGTDFNKKLLAVDNQATVTASINLTEADRTYLDGHFENGMYVDGFISLDGVVDLSVPFLAFYGNWSDSSMFEHVDYMKECTTGVKTQAYNDNNTTNLLIHYIESKGGSYKLDPFSSAEDKTYIEDRNALSANLGHIINGVAYTLIRNASSISIRIINAETSEEYYSEQHSVGTIADGFFLSTFHDGAGWQNKSVALALDCPWNMTDSSGETLPDGTKVKIIFEALPYYYNSGDHPIGRGTKLEFNFTMDSTKPTIVSNTQSGGYTTITMKDNRYIAKIEVINPALDPSSPFYYIYKKDICQTTPNTETSVYFHTPDANYNVVVTDYAGNKEAVAYSVAATP